MKEPLIVAEPTKAFSEMTEDEHRDFAEWLYNEMMAKLPKTKGSDPDVVDGLG